MSSAASFRSALPLRGGSPGDVGSRYAVRVSFSMFIPSGSVPLTGAVRWTSEQSLVRRARPHRPRLACAAYTAFGREPEGLGMQIQPALAGRFVLLDNDWVRLGERVATHARD